MAKELVWTDRKRIVFGLPWTFTKYSLTKEKLLIETGIFNKETAEKFRKEILSRGSIEDADVIYRNFRGRDPEPEALLKKFGMVK